MAVSAPAKTAANEKSTPHRAVRTTSSVRLIRSFDSAAATFPPPLASATPLRRQTPATHQARAPATAVAMRCHPRPDQRAAAAGGCPASAGAMASRSGPLRGPRAPCGTHHAAHMGVAARLARPKAGATPSAPAVRPCAPRAVASNSASMLSRACRLPLPDASPVYWRGGQDEGGGGGGFPRLLFSSCPWLWLCGSLGPCLGSWGGGPAGGRRGRKGGLESGRHSPYAAARHTPASTPPPARRQHVSGTHEPRKTIWRYGAYLSCAWSWLGWAPG